MDFLISMDNSSNVILPVSFIFWGFIAVYALHIIEESLLGENFVDKMKKRFWPEYDWKKFFGFNTILMSLNVIAVVLFEVFGGAWVIFPLGLAAERVLNGFWHFGEMIVTKRFSSGTLTGLIFWIFGYFIIRYSVVPGQIPAVYAWISLAIGAVMTALMFGSMMSFRMKFMKKVKKRNH
jgi:hypothetical protein